MSERTEKILNVRIDNFKGIKRCPYCDERPKEMIWTDLGIKLACRNPECPGPKYLIYVYIPKEEIDLKKMTFTLIDDWNQYCMNIKGRLIANAQTNL